MYFTQRPDRGMVESRFNRQFVYFSIYLFYLEHLLILRDLVFHLAASGGDEGPARHLLESLFTATRRQSHHTSTHCGKSKTSQTSKNAVRLKLLTIDVHQRPNDAPLRATLMLIANANGGIR